jgi:hypothetical protein
MFFVINVILGASLMATACWIGETPREYSVAFTVLGGLIAGIAALLRGALGG